MSQETSEQHEQKTIEFDVYRTKILPELRYSEKLRCFLDSLVKHNAVDCRYVQRFYERFAQVIQYAMATDQEFNQCFSGKLNEKTHGFALINELCQLPGSLFRDFMDQEMDLFVEIVRFNHS